VPPEDAVARHPDHDGALLDAVDQLANVRTFHWPLVAHNRANTTDDWNPPFPTFLTKHFRSLFKAKRPVIEVERRCLKAFFCHTVSEVIADCNPILCMVWDGDKVYGTIH
jgi:hypothetical protein